MYCYFTMLCHLFMIHCLYMILLGLLLILYDLLFEIWNILFLWSGLGLWNILCILLGRLLLLCHLLMSLKTLLCILGLLRCELLRKKRCCFLRTIFCLSLFRVIRNNGGRLPRISSSCLLYPHLEVVERPPLELVWLMKMRKV